MPKEFDYYRLYLLKFLRDTEDPRQDDGDFISSRAELAGEEFEEARRDGLTVDQAQERAIEVLMEGID